MGRPCPFPSPPALGQADTETFPTPPQAPSALCPSPHPPGALLPVVHVLAESQGRHLHLSLSADQAVPSGQVLVHKAIVGQVLHAQGHLGAQCHLQRERGLSDSPGLEIKATVLHTTHGEVSVPSV